MGLSFLGSGAGGGEGATRLAGPAHFFSLLIFWTLSHLPASHHRDDMHCSPYTIWYVDGLQHCPAGKACIGSPLGLQQPSACLMGALFTGGGDGSGGEGGGISGGLMVQRLPEETLKLTSHALSSHQRLDMHCTPSTTCSVSGLQHCVEAKPELLKLGLQQPGSMGLGGGDGAGGG